MTRIGRLTVVVHGGDPARAAELGRDVAAQLARAGLETASGVHRHVAIGPVAPDAAGRATAEKLGTRP